MMNTKKENNVLNQSLASRQRKIQTAKDYLARTQQLFEEFGSAELKTTHARFTELESALSSDQVRIVVLGEFTRGKSRLLNALLNIDLLPTALETTTAVNTFLRALPAGRSERFILIHYQDKKRPPQEVSWTEDNALIRWGTELDKSNADARMELDYIEVFLDHPLLQKGLVLVDTPGLGAIVKHHEQITRKAIAESHIALWVQATDMLGGCKAEWDFMSETLCGNFQKFITVINKWDRVLEPEDYQDKQLSEAERIQKKLQIVKNNFASILGNEDSVELATLTDTNHLMGVSAQWAQDKDPEKRRRSNIDHLAERIGDMVSSGEAINQILLKPLQQIATVQKQLADRIQDELKQLESTDSLEKRKQELQQLEIDIRNLENDEKRETGESHNEHARAAKAISEKVRQELTAPLSALKESIEDQVTESYVKKMIASKAKKIGLPEGLEHEFKEVSAQVDKAWQTQKTGMTQVLDGLRAGYLQKMEKHTQQIEAGVGKLNINLPSLDVSLDLDFSTLEVHHKKVAELNEAMERAQDEIHDLEAEIIDKSNDGRKLQQAQAEVDRCARQLENMGPAPVPVTTRKRQKSGNWGSGFLWLSSTYEVVDVTDDSNLRAHERDKKEKQEQVLSKEAAIKKIIEDEERETRVKMNAEAAKKKAEKKYAEMEKKATDAARQAGQEQDALIVESVQKLSRNTTAQLTQTIKFLDIYAADTIHAVFMDQAALLKQCVSEQLLEPVNAKRAQLQEIETLLHQGKAEIAQRKAKLTTAQRDIAELQALTHNTLNA